MLLNSNKAVIASLTGIAAAVLLTAGLTTLLYARVALDDDTHSRSHLTVELTDYQLQESYQRQVSYLGLVVAGRKANLGFEIPGQIASMPLREGSPVRAGELIASLDDAALQARRRATVAELEQTAAELELARLKAQRQKDLRATGAVSKEAYDETRLRAQALESFREAVSARLAGIDIELEKSRLVAPYDGIIADRYVYQGAVVSPGGPVVRLIETAAKEAHVGVPAELAGTLQQGKSYTLKLRKQVFPATLTAVRPDVEPLTRTTNAVFAVPPEVTALDGEAVTLELSEPVTMKGGWLPMAALLEGQRGVWNVLRVEEQPDGSYHTIREAVEILDLQGSRAYVRGTLAADARVVASGVHRITPGTVVQLAEQN